MISSWTQPIFIGLNLMIMTKKIESRLVSDDFFPAILYWKKMSQYFLMFSLNHSMINNLSFSPKNTLRLNLRPHLDGLSSLILLEKCETMSIFPDKLKSLLGFSKKLPFEGLTPSRFNGFRYNLLLESFVFLYESKFAELSAREL